MSGNIFLLSLIFLCIFCCKFVVIFQWLSQPYEIAKCLKHYVGNYREKTFIGLKISAHG